MDIDDVFLVHPSDQPTQIADLLKWSYALCLQSVISEVVQKYCHGCRCDHPSQMEHDGCILKPYEEQVHDYFEEALTLVDEDCVVGHWLGDLGGISPSICYHEVT